MSPREQRQADKHSGDAADKEIAPEVKEAKEELAQEQAAEAAAAPDAEPTEKEPTGPEAEGTAAAETGVDKPAAEAEEKPKRRRARRKPAEAEGQAEAAAEAPAAEAEAGAEAPAAEAEAEESPEAMVEAARAKEAEAKPDHSAEKAEPPEAVQPARRRRRGRAAAEEEKPAEPEPRRRGPRREPGAAPPIVRAQARYVRSSARKARLVCDHIRGKSVPEARAILAFSSRSVARDWIKVLESAIANAEHNHDLVGDELKVVSAHADEGPTLKRFRPRAMGRATRIRKRTTHLTITLTPKD